MVYGAALEMRFGGNPIEGSNPSLSATIFPYGRSRVEWRYELCGTRCVAWCSGGGA